MFDRNTGFMAPPDLRQRLQDRWLPLQNGDPDTVHAVRKLTRKAQAQLRVSGAPGKTRRAWKRLRRVLGTLRDLDVARTHLDMLLRDWTVSAQEQHDFQQAWARRRRSALKALRRLDLPPRIRVKRHWKRRARKRVRDDWQALQQQAVVVLSSDDPGQWHAWRKRLKRYRYTLALTGPVPDALPALLDALGRMQDAQVLRELVGSQGWFPDERDRLQQAEAKVVALARDEVRTIWPTLQAPPS